MKALLHFSCSIILFFVYSLTFAQSDISQKERERYWEMKKNQTKKIEQNSKTSSSLTSLANPTQNSPTSQSVKKTPQQLSTEEQKKYWINQLEQNRLLDDKARLQIKLELAKLSNSSSQIIQQEFSSEKIAYSSKDLIEKWKKQNPAFQQEIILWNQRFPNQPIRWQEIKSISILEKKQLLDKIQEEKELDNPVK